ncbi:hypothetical protein CH63R_04124 [Colletotrichum higginsianum IMI 349063]|uniref:Uncharacterized protein n=1 Tax=Colletotrichum higginsianum (strain IMI 349063) TaxID=759273 RepID=A0A1B7YJ10_COLHI|nr:hypothetical protein CH63R_04124 [Colletotrichum higginsianum IMI 349063]OBR11828.1 hypothetical protein CH63R_04124 [Colletotrichum higginsianum IMI 349063]
MMELGKTPLGEMRSSGHSSISISRPLLPPPLAIFDFEDETTPLVPNFRWTNRRPDSAANDGFDALRRPIATARRQAQPIRRDVYARHKQRTANGQHQPAGDETAKRSAGRHLNHCVGAVWVM